MKDEEENTWPIRLVESRWYRAILILILPVWIGLFLILFLGIPDWPYISEVPRDFYLILFLVVLGVLFPSVLVSLKAHQENNKNKYDPESPGVKKLIRRLRKIGWAFSLLGIFFVSLIFALPESESDFLTSDLSLHLTSGLIVLCIFLAVFGFHFARHIETGMMAPPRWMIPSDDEENWE
ncbi:MAG: hypothetical protein AAGD92_08615 [Pseudomonadota bacterium]